MKSRFAAGTDAISDAYATNVIGDDEVWVYFCMDYRIVRVVDVETRPGSAMWRARTW